MTPPRVVSLVPSATETLRALGCTPVACTRFCDQPDLAVVGGTKTPDVAAIIAAAPDVVVMNDEENRRADFDALRAAGLTIVDVSPRTMADVGDAVARLAATAGTAVPSPFDVWPEWLAAHRSVGATRIGVTMVWRRPWMALGRDTYGAAVLGALGVRTPSADGRYPEVTLEGVGARAPDLVLLPDEPYPFAERHVDEVRAVLPDTDVRLVDGRDLFWWGIRTPVAIDRLASRLSGRRRRADRD